MESMEIYHFYQIDDQKSFTPPVLKIAQPFTEIVFTQISVLIIIFTAKQNVNKNSINLSFEYNYSFELKGYMQIYN